MPTCPDCSQSVPVPTDALAGEILACGSCEAELEVVTLDPVALALAPELEEDWGE